MRTVRCYCDTCGKESFCYDPRKAPPGWFYYDIQEEPGTVDEKGDKVLVTTILACSERCKSIPWKRQRGTPTS